MSRSAYYARQRSSPISRGALFLALGALFHVWAFLALDVALQWLPRPERRPQPPASLIVLVPPKDKMDEEEPEDGDKL